MTEMIACSRWIISAALLTSALGGVHAQTPAQLDYERQQREYQRQQEQQRQEQQRQQQIQQENARRQQEELNRSIRSSIPSSSSPSTQGTGSSSTGSGSPSTGPATSSPKAPEDERKMWEKQPPLSADRNPLLGKWSHFGRKTPAFLRDSWDRKSIQACDELFADNWYVEFQPDFIVIVNHDRRWRPLAEVTYRGGDRRVAILPKYKMRTVPDVIVVDITSPVKAQLVKSECKMARIGDSTAGTGR